MLRGWHWWWWESWAMRVHPLLLQQVLLLVVHATSGVHQLGEVLQLVLLELLAWVGGAWRG